MQNEFGKRLKKVRLEKEISILKLANASGISETLLQNIESEEKKPRLSYPVIVKIAEVLGVSIDELIDIQFV